MAPPLCTIVVVPRETFSKAPASYAALSAHNPSGYPVIYIDSCSPRSWARRLDTLAANGRIKLIRTGFHISQQEAYNLALPHVRTRYVIFLDNDALVTPGWTESLLNCAEETGAAAVLPLIEEKGGNDSWHIHMCGGDCGVMERDGRLWFREVHPMHGHTDYKPLTRLPTGLLEYHAFLVRMEILQKIGPFDEGYTAALDHTDFSLMIRAAAGTIWLEPAALVKYPLPPPFQFQDLGFFLTRWSNSIVTEDQRHFAQKWGVQFPPDHGDWYRHHRRRILHPLRETIARRFGRIAGKITYRLLCPLEAIASRLIERWNRIPDRRERLQKLGAWRAAELDRAEVEAFAAKIFHSPRVLHRDPTISAERSPAAYQPTA